MSDRLPPSALPMPALNEMRLPGAREPGALVCPAGVDARFVRQGPTWRLREHPEAIAVVDRGSRMHTFAPEAKAVVSAMVMTAQARGWRAMEVTGTEAFRRAAYIEATARGMPVTGHEPSDADRAAAHRSGELIASLRNPMVQAYLKATSAADRRAACSTYPPLDKAFKAEDAARQAAVTQRGLGEKGAERFLARFRENTAIALHHGRAIPDVARNSRGGEVSR